MLAMKRNHCRSCSKLHDTDVYYFEGKLEAILVSSSLNPSFLCRLEAFITSI